eukprot:CAMPEP_0113910490 /NCGR_PEP_ID=MMETSP0780_2-20120614/27556_1 /TAXON_ID=652834 /ORGANISM="Palpitomonas bilix" /LENGTH=835 /DNA_ID=CAMNT_0000906655 /DNA_START=372 /DNA_END=2879 /DNA_ORIENTATION=+ /assembly_acc=CAM_ASM_000599
MAETGAYSYPPTQNDPPPDGVRRDKRYYTPIEVEAFIRRYLPTELKEAYAGAPDRQALAHAEQVRHFLPQETALKILHREMKRVEKDTGLLKMAVTAERPKTGVKPVFDYPAGIRPHSPSFYRLRTEEELEEEREQKEKERREKERKEEEERIRKEEEEREREEKKREEEEREKEERREQRGRLKGETEEDDVDMRELLLGKKQEEREEKKSEGEEEEEGEVNDSSEVAPADGEEGEEEERGKNSDEKPITYREKAEKAREEERKKAEEERKERIKQLADKERAEAAEKKARVEKEGGKAPAVSKYDFKFLLRAPEKLRMKVWSCCGSPMKDRHHANCSWVAVKQQEEYLEKMIYFRAEVAKALAGSDRYAKSLRFDCRRKGCTQPTLNKEPMGAAGMFGLREALRLHRRPKGLRVSVDVLDLQGQDMEDPGLKCLLDVLFDVAYVKNLRLGQNKLTAGGVGVLGDAVRNSLTLEFLSLRKNTLGEVGGHAMGLLLRRNLTICYLDLEGCAIGGGGARALGEGLKDNKTLDTLNIKNNGIDERGAVPFFQAIISCKIRDINIEGNPIGNNGCRALVSLLRRNKAIEKLAMKNNAIGSGRRKPMSEYAKEKMLEMKTSSQLNKKEEEEKAGESSAPPSDVKDVLPFDTIYSLTELWLAKFFDKNMDFLRGNRLNDSEVREVLKALRGFFDSLPSDVKEESVPDEVDLSDNLFGDGGVVALMEDMDEFQLVRRWNLSSNRIGNYGAFAVAKRVRTMARDEAKMVENLIQRGQRDAVPRPFHINLRNNHIGIKGQDTLLDAARAAHGKVGEAMDVDFQFNDLAGYTTKAYKPQPQFFL